MTMSSSYSWVDVALHPQEDFVTLGLHRTVMMMVQSSAESQKHTCSQSGPILPHYQAMIQYDTIHHSGPDVIRIYLHLLPGPLLCLFPCHLSTPLSLSSSPSLQHVTLSLPPCLQSSHKRGELLWSVCNAAVRCRLTGA